MLKNSSAWPAYCDAEAGLCDERCDSGERGDRTKSRDTPEALVLELKAGLADPGYFERLPGSGRRRRQAEAPARFFFLAVGVRGESFLLSIYPGLIRRKVRSVCCLSMALSRDVCHEGGHCVFVDRLVPTHMLVCSCLSRGSGKGGVVVARMCLLVVGRFVPVVFLLVAVVKREGSDGAAGIPPPSSTCPSFFLYGCATLFSTAATPSSRGSERGLVENEVWYFVTVFG